MAAPLLGRDRTLACERCVIDRGGNCCTTTRGDFVDGQVAAPEGQADVGSWSYHLKPGAHRSLTTPCLRSGLPQGAATA
ncbi:hypothetical protein SMD44_08968 [Streptomyces alboflavus]|uniref:Uncharacterized protein n=1 Tax=Streptomyces alboflavus TaxID=67267 RepID=A0A1Z1WSQ2_9ACTN|nr:hypothetical protein [Streptomyces alboflavus]ARX89481.1 hypothetical protein SMD44_08968 [Streptomyces alboflavus]